MTKENFGKIVWNNIWKWSRKDKCESINL